MKKLSKILSILLCLAMLIGVVAVMVGATGETTTYTKVTDASTLAAGDKIVIGATKDGTTYYAGALSGKFLSSQNSTDSAAVYVLGGQAGAWTLTSTAGEAILYKANKELTNDTSNSAATATWSISIAANGSATIASTANSESRILYNSQASRFLNYESATSANMLLPNIYKVSDGSAVSTETSSSAPEASSSAPEASSSAPEESSSAAAETTMTVVENPATGVAYKMGMYQGTNGEVLYFTGAMSGYYFATSNDFDAGVDVYLEAAEGGYYVFFENGSGRQYLYLEKNGKYNNVKFGETKSVFTFGDFHNLETTLEGSELYLGTFGSNTTIGASYKSYIEGENAAKVDAPNGQYVVRLYTEEIPEESTPASTGATSDTSDTGDTGDTGDKKPGDTLSVFVGLLAVSTVGLAVVTSKKKRA